MDSRLALRVALSVDSFASKKIAPKINSSLAFSLPAMAALPVRVLPSTASG